MYPGSGLSDKNIAVVSVPDFFRCSKVDGQTVWRPNRIEFLPGEHVVKIGMTGRRDAARYAGSPVELPFRVEAGRRYRMKICCFVDVGDEIFEPHSYYVRKLGGSRADALAMLGVVDSDGWSPLSFLPDTVSVAWTPYLVEDADGSLVPYHPDPKVAAAVRALLALVKKQRETL